MQSETLLDLQPPSNSAILLVALCLIGLFVVAVLMERSRRKRLDRQRLQNDWKSFREVVEEKDLSRKEADLLEKLVKRWSNDHPVRPATTRREFSILVNHEMDRIKDRGKANEYAEIGKQLREIRKRLSLENVPLGQRIHTTRDLGVGRVLNIGREKGERTRFVPFVIVSVDEAYLFLRPKADGMHPPETYRRGEKLPCRLWRDTDARYTFELPFDDVQGPDKLWRFGHTKALVRHQAREYYRVPYNEVVKVEVIDEPMDKDYADVAERPAVTHFDGRVTSLSAGGLAVRLPQAISRRVLLRMTLPLDGKEEALAVCSIVSVQSEPDGTSAVRCFFVGMGADARDAISHYITQRQQPLAGPKKEDV